MTDFHAFDNTVMARVTRTIRKVAIIPLISLLGAIQPAHAAEPTPAKISSTMADAALSVRCSQTVGVSLDHVILFKQSGKAYIRQLMDAGFLAEDMSPEMFEQALKQKYGTGAYQDGEFSAGECTKFAFQIIDLKAKQ